MKKTVRIDPFSYAFSVGKVRVLENYLLKEDEIRNLINLDLPLALESLSNHKIYGTQILKLDTFLKWEDFLEKQKEKLDTLLKKLIIREEIFTIIKDALAFPKKALKITSCVESKFLKDYFKYYVDFINIKTLFSLKDKKEFIEGGFIPLNEFFKLKEKSPEEILLFFKHTPYSRLVTEGIGYFKEHSTFVYLESLFQSFLVDFIKKYKYNAFGFEPVVAYYLAKLNEFNLLRTIFLGKFLGLDKEFLNKALTTTYV